MRQLYIFDLDGTLANDEHRKHYLRNPDNMLWEDYFQACDLDAPNQHIVNIFNTLIKENDCYIWTGRNDMVKEKTFKWIECYLDIPFKYEFEDIIKMRPANNRDDDTVLKYKWLSELPAQDRSRLQCVFEDRNRVVKMWRENNVNCLHVAEGNF